MNNLVPGTGNKIDNHRESSDFRVIWELTRIIYVHDPGGTNNNTLDTSEDRGEGDLRNLNPPNSTRKADFNTTGRQFLFISRVQQRASYAAYSKFGSIQWLNFENYFLDSL